MARSLPLPMLGVTDLRRFWAKVDYSTTPGDCWTWKGGRTADGYGVFAMRRGRKWQNVLATRVSVLLATDADPYPLQVLHRCDNPRCVNPEHLFLGDQRENLRDCYAKGRARNLHGAQHYNARLTEAQVSTVRQQVRVRGDQARLARELGVSPSTINDIVKHRSWKRESEAAR